MTQIAEAGQQPGGVEGTHGLLDFGAANPLNSVPVQMARAIAFLGKQVELALCEVGLSDAQYRMLCLLSRGTYSSSAAAGLLGVSPPSVTSIVEGMLDRQLVRRGPSPVDRRLVELSITDFGYEVLGRADAAVSDRLGAIADHAEDQSRRDEHERALLWWAEAMRRSATARYL